MSILTSALTAKAELPRNSAPRKSQAAYAIDPNAFDLIYGLQDRAALRELLDISDDVISNDNWRSHPTLLREVEYIFAGWKCPRMDEEFLTLAPKLKAVFYAAGSIKAFVTDAFWARGITVCSAAAANAVPVAEYTVAVMILGMKQFWRLADAARRGDGWGDHTRPIPGVFRGTVGLVSFGMIARKVVEMLAAYDVRIRVYCPFLEESTADEFGVERVSLDEVFAGSDVVSVHTPDLPETRGLIQGRHLGLMRPGATFINTARGVILDQPSVVDALRARADITAVLDVTQPEPPAPEDPLLALPNVIVTPHIAGAHGRDCQRLGNYMIDEFRRYLSHQPLRWQITRELALTLA